MDGIPAALYSKINIFSPHPLPSGTSPPNEKPSPFQTNAPELN
jgi:hypothetical protein